MEACARLVSQEAAGLPFGGILYLHETQKNPQKVTKASTGIGVRCKWVKFKFWVNYPFNYTNGINISLILGGGLITEVI